MSHISKNADLQPNKRHATTVKKARKEVPFIFWAFSLQSFCDWSLKRAIKRMTKIDDDNSVIQRRSKTSKHSELRNKTQRRLHKTHKM